MPILKPIQYSRFVYPNHIIPNIQEIAGHFDIDDIKPVSNYSLHTEYSYGKRNYSTNLIKSHSIIIESSSRNIPQLWKNEQWSRDFSGFLVDLIGQNKPPEIIEVHPPFSDYCKSLKHFLEIYNIFEIDIMRHFNNVKILLENRYGTMYAGGVFIVSKNYDIIELCRLLNEFKAHLRIVIDFPQLLSSHNLDTYNTSPEKLHDIFEPLHQIRNMIEGLHVWGKKKNDKGRAVAHQGNLDTLFPNYDLKNCFIKEIYDLFNDDKPRYFVPEVNSGNEDVHSIVNDLIVAGFKFIN